MTRTASKHQQTGYSTTSPPDTIAPVEVRAHRRDNADARVLLRRVASPSAPRRQTSRLRARDDCGGDDDPTASRVAALARSRSTITPRKCHQTRTPKHEAECPLPHRLG